jgi:hypothetical protein
VEALNALFAWTVFKPALIGAGFFAAIRSPTD